MMHGQCRNFPLSYVRPGLRVGMCLSVKGLLIWICSRAFNVPNGVVSVSSQHYTLPSFEKVEQAWQMATTYCLWKKVFEEAEHRTERGFLI